MNYSFFNKIVCINLKERKDKYNSVNEVFTKLKIPVDFYFATKHPKSGRIGCFESHINVITDFYNNNGKYILIFEDDAVDMLYYDINILNEITNFLKENITYEYFQLGYTILPHEIYKYLNSNFLNKNKNILQYNGNTTHSYILNRNGAKRILSTWKTACYDNNLDLDIYYKIIFEKNGACSCPLLFDQNFCIQNDNEPATTNYYIMMRYLSCFQTKYSICYFISLLKYYFKYYFLIVFLFLLILISFIICMIYYINQFRKIKYNRKLR